MFQLLVGVHLLYMRCWTRRQGTWGTLSTRFGGGEGTWLGGGTAGGCFSCFGGLLHLLTLDWRALEHRGRRLRGFEAVNLALLFFVIEIQDQIHWFDGELATIIQQNRIALPIIHKSIAITNTQIKIIAA